MNAASSIIKKQNQKIMEARDSAANILISISVRLDQILDDKYIDSLEKYDLRDANNCIKRAIKRIKPVRRLPMGGMDQLADNS